MLRKYEIVEQNPVRNKPVFLRERVKIFVRCFLFMTLLSFFFLFYSPAYFQLAFFKKADVAVNGWGINISRFIPLYILPNNDTCLICNKELCSEPLKLLVIVCSAVKNIERRIVIRETWGNYSFSSFKVAFLLGKTRNVTLQEKIENEARIYGDIIQENFVDSYYNLTLKSVMLLKYIKNHCDKVRFVLKSDDDMFINIKNLLQLVNAFIRKKYKNVLVGELICNAKPIHNSLNKWYCPRYMYDGAVYPHYLSGTGYLMDRATAVALYKAALKTPLLHLEDVYITGLCARKANITPKYQAGFSYQTRPVDPCLYKSKSIITSHRVSLANMRHIWKGIHNGSTCARATVASKKKVPHVIKISSYRKNRC